jgi:hypothetical protein
MVTFFLLTALRLSLALRLTSVLSSNSERLVKFVDVAEVKTLLDFVRVVFIFSMVFLWFLFSLIYFCYNIPFSKNIR